MPHEPSGSFPTSIDVPVTEAPETGARERVLRAALLGWAAAVYLVYWLGYLGAR
jgi:hypothetical protein